VEELTKLQDKVPAFSYEQAKEAIEQDLGKPLDVYSLVLTRFP
jgi:predicted unusual protein kinase regulating ubiquinone biosynthesis (AarF/ABC1/UbiB family)